MNFDEVLRDAVRKDSIRVPPYPSTALKLQQVLGRPDFATADLVAAMRTDAVFTGNLLRLANSPFYRRGDPVTSLPVAVTRVGGKELSRLALAATVSSAAAGAGPLAEVRRHVWRQSLTSALVCEVLAPLDGGDAGEAFVAGLLHDAGKLLVIGCLEDALGKAPGTAAKPWAEWLPLLEAHHVAFGLALAAKWQLPEALKAVVQHHHDDPPPSAACARVVRSDAVVALMEASPTVDAAMLAAVTGLPAEACERLAARLPGIPGTISAFEPKGEGPAAGAPKAVAVSAVAPRATGATLSPVALVFEVRSEGPALALDVRAADDGRFVALAKAPLQTNRLVEFHLVGNDLTVWAVAQQVRRVGEAFEVECSLFAMSPELTARWRQVRQGASPPAAA